MGSYNYQAAAIAHAARRLPVQHATCADGAAADVGRAQPGWLAAVCTRGVFCVMLEFDVIEADPDGELEDWQLDAVKDQCCAACCTDVTELWLETPRNLKGTAIAYIDAEENVWCVECFHEWANDDDIDDEAKDSDEESEENADREEEDINGDATSFPMLKPKPDSITISGDGKLVPSGEYNSTNLMAMGTMF